MKYATLVLLVLISSLAGCRSSFSKAYIEDCLDEGFPKAVCECAADKIDKHYGKKTIDSFQGSNRMPADFPFVVMDAQSSCAAKGN